jgi:hypothetical protein
MEAKVLRDFLKKTCQSVLDCNACILNGIGVGLCCYGDATDEMIDKAIAAAQNQGAQPAQAEQKCIFCGNICNDVSEAHYPYKKGRAHWHCIMNERAEYKPAPLAFIESRSSWVSVKTKLAKAVELLERSNRGCTQFEAREISDEIDKFLTEYRSEQKPLPPVEAGKDKR